jgi:hypothetical protein
MSSRSSIKYIAAAFAIFLFIFVILSTNSARRVNPRLELVQTSVSDFTPELLRERSPILIEEQLLDPVSTLKKLLRFQHTYSPRVRARAPSECKSYLTAVFQDVQDAAVLQLEHPTNGATFPIVVKRDQVTIVPYSWRLATSVQFKSVEF